MDEIPRVPEEQKLEPKVLTEIIYRPGQENKATFFPFLENLPIKHAFSWGKKSGNMSPVYAGGESEEAIRARIKSFLEASGIKYKNDANTAGIFEGSHLQMQEIVFEDLKSQPETRFEANFIYTKDPRILLSIRPGDCDVSIVYAKNRNGEDLAGIVHSSALSTNAGLPRFAIDYLVEEEGVDPSKIRIGITPGISGDHYGLNDEPDIINNKTIDKVIVERNWKQHIAKTKDSKGFRSVDITGATIMQFIEAGVRPENIEAYDLDTYQSADMGETFSNRFSAENGKPQGRYMVAVQLKQVI